MANKKLQTRFGNIKKLGWNPRNISKVAFSNLCESIFRDPDFMVARPIIIDENNDILGGNQRYTALQNLYEQLSGMSHLDGDWKTLSEGRIPDNWVQQVVGWSDDKKKRFNLIDNSPAGIAGTFDYDILKQEFDLDILSESGMDLTNVVGESEIGDYAKSLVEKAEESDYGQDNQPNEDFEEYKAAKKESREELDDAMDIGFHCDFVFQSYEQKLDFLKKSGIESRYGLFADGLVLAEKMGIKLIDGPTHVFSQRKPETRLKEIAMETPKTLKDNEHEKNS